MSCETFNDSVTEMPFEVPFQWQGGWSAPYDALNDLADELRSRFSCLEALEIDKSDVVDDLGIDPDDLPELELEDTTGALLGVRVALGVKRVDVCFPSDPGIPISMRSISLSRSSTSFVARG